MDGAVVEAVVDVEVTVGEMTVIIEEDVTEATEVIAIQTTGRNAVRMIVPMDLEMTATAVTTRVDVDEADVMIEVPAATTTETVSVVSVMRRMCMIAESHS
jgi:Zn finger protein HypA/HybF involved in hydrogenase expression